MRASYPNLPIKKTPAARIRLAILGYSDTTTARRHFLGDEMKQHPEYWKPIPGFSGYEVSSAGRVRSSGNRILKPGLAGAGYPHVSLGSGNQRYVHRLVLLAFVGDSPLTANHKNGIKTDNRLENLEYLTQSANNRHAYAIGLKEPSAAIGVQHPKSKLTQEQADEIRRRYATERIGKAKLAAQYGVTKIVVTNILRGSAYRPSQKQYATPVPSRPTTGESNPMAKLNADQVSRIRERLATGARPVDLAREFNVSSASICDIKSRRTWK